jgi:hypothetical protein
LGSGLLEKAMEDIIEMHLRVIRYFGGYVVGGTGSEQSPVVGCGIRLHS